MDTTSRYHSTKAVSKTAVPKTAVNRPIIEFDGIEGFFYWRPFWEAAFLARNLLIITITNAKKKSTTLQKYVNNATASGFYPSKPCRSCEPRIGMDESIKSIIRSNARIERVT